MYNVNLVLVKWFNNYKYAYVSEKIPVYAEMYNNINVTFNNGEPFAGFF